MGVSVLEIVPDISIKAPVSSGCVLPVDAAQRLLPAMPLRSTDPTARWQIITCGSEKCLLCNWLMENVFQADASHTGTPMNSHCLVLPSWHYLNSAVDCAYGTQLQTQRGC